MLVGPVDHDVAGGLEPLGQGVLVVGARLHEALTRRLTVEESVDPLEVEAEVRLGAGFGQRVLLGAAGHFHALVLPEREGGDHRREDQQCHGDGLADPHDRRNRQHRGAGTHEEGDLADLFGAGLCFLELDVAFLDASNHRGVLGGRPGGVGLFVEDLTGGGHPVGEVPQTARFDGREPSDDLVVMRAGRQVGRGQPEQTLGRAGIDPADREKVDVAVVVGEARTDVGRGLDVDHAGTSAEGTEHGEAVAVVGHDLGVHTRPARAQRADELGDEPLSLEPSDAADDGESGMEFQRECVLVSLNDKPVESHAPPTARADADLSHLAQGGGAFRPWPSFASEAGWREVCPVASLPTLPRGGFQPGIAGSLSSVGRASPW